MFSIRHIAISTFAGLALSFGFAGCAPDHPDVIPSSAQKTVTGRIIHYTASNDGMVYLYDKPAQKLLWSGRVMRGQAVDVDPEKNQIMVAGSVMANKALNPNNENELYFDASPMLAPVPNQASYTPPSNNSVIVTPSATVQPNNGQATPPGTVTVQPGLIVSPAPQPAQNPQP